MADEWADLSDSELRARLAQRGRVDAAWLTDNRDNPACARIIERILGDGDPD